MKTQSPKDKTKKRFCNIPVALHVQLLPPVDTLDPQDIAAQLELLSKLPEHFAEWEHKS